jgi:Leucine Rich repeat
LGLAREFSLARIDGLASKATFRALGSMSALRSLSLEYCKGVGPAEVATLFANDTQLAMLSITYCNLGDDSLAALAASSSRSLRAVDFTATEITSVGVMNLLRSPAGAKIERFAAWAVELDLTPLVRELQNLPKSHPLREIGIENLDLGARFVAPDS